MSKIVNELARLLGMAILALLIVGGMVAIVYVIFGEFTNEGRHWLATGLAFAVPAAYVMGLQYAKSHRAGLERGLDLKLGARERAQQRPIAAPPATTPSVSQTPAITAATQAARWNEDLLPARSGQAVIITRRDDNTNPIEM